MRLITFFLLAIGLICFGMLSFASAPVSATFRARAVADGEYVGQANCATRVEILSLELPAEPGDFRLRAGDSLEVLAPLKQGDCPRIGRTISGTLVFQPAEGHGEWDYYYGQNLRW